MFPLILTFDINLILGSFLGFWGQMDYFWAGDMVEKIFRGLLMHTNNFCFLNITLFLLYLLLTFFLCSINIHVFNLNGSPSAFYPSFLSIKISSVQN